MSSACLAAGNTLKAQTGFLAHLCTGQGKCCAAQVVPQDVGASFCLHAHGLPLCAAAIKCVTVGVGPQQSCELCNTCMEHGYVNMNLEVHSLMSQQAASICCHCVKVQCCPAL